MATETITSDIILNSELNDCIKKYMDAFELIKYFDTQRYSFYWGKYIKTNWFLEMIFNKAHIKHGEIAIDYCKNTNKITCYSENKIFTKICCGMEQYIKEQLGLPFDVEIILQY